MKNETDFKIGDLVYGQPGSRLDTFGIVVDRGESPLLEEYWWGVYIPLDRKTYYFYSEEIMRAAE